MNLPDTPYFNLTPNRRPPAPDAAPDPALRRAAEALEARFLAEMLRSAGLDSPRHGLGGGAAEDHFTSFMIEARAEALSRAGGVGLAESIYSSMIRAAHATD